MTLQNRSLRKKISANVLADRYRAGTPFNREVIENLRYTIGTLGKCSQLLTDNLGFNKATAQTCLVFSYQLVRQLQTSDAIANHLAKFFIDFSDLIEFSELAVGNFYKKCVMVLTKETIESLSRIYRERTASRVSDTSSVVLRDFVIWSTFAVYANDFAEISGVKELERIRELIPQMKNLGADKIEELVMAVVWDLST
jgi:hypothetical protein